MRIHALGFPAIASISLALAACAGTGTSAPQVTPPGAPKTAAATALERGAAVLQAQAPLRPMDMYMVGFHAAKDDPSQQMESHHYCQQVNEEFAQCVLFDGNTSDANLVGIEYIISEDTFESLPEEEKRYWHPHNYEILSGQLVMPGLPDTLEEEALRGMLNTYGKTWRLWNAKPFDARGDKLPLGEPVLVWSFNRDGEAVTELVKTRDSQMQVSTAAKRLKRRDLVPLARPQQGVDDLDTAFPRPTRSIPGVVEKRTAGDKTR